MMIKNKKMSYTLIGVGVAILIGLGVWLYQTLFEDEKPIVAVQPLPQFLSKDQTILIKAGDQKRGLRSIKVTLSQQSHKITIYEETFGFVGLFNQGGTHQFSKEIPLNAVSLKLAQGQAQLDILVRDYSHRDNGEGNPGTLQHTMIIDTVPPFIQPLSRLHYINNGGTGLVIYQVSADALSNGVLVDNLLFTGFPADPQAKNDIYLAYFSVPPAMGHDPVISLWAKDAAGNENKAPFNYRILPKKFCQDKIDLSDVFLTNVLPYFSFYLTDAGESAINKFLKINRDLRKENHTQIIELCRKSDPMRHWDGPFLRMQNASPMASYADKRSYFYQGKKMDEQTHLGVDLASLANAPIAAANHGRVIFADRLGIYGLAVMIDHGQGLVSLYGHMSKVNVTPDQAVKKGDVIGHSGMTGLAGGDHLHFSMLVNGVFVNPIEWWDDHWIQNNIMQKLALIRR